MKTIRQLKTVFKGTILIISMPLLGVLNSSPSQSLVVTKDLGVQTSSLANQSANAALNVNDTVPRNKTVLVSQATGSLIRFVPPVTRNPRTSQGAGSRGGCEQSSIPAEDLVTLLIPSKDYIGQTTSSHPSFFWYLSESVSVPMQFTLRESGVSKPLYQKQLDSPRPGIIQLEIPKDRNGLVPGKSYGWSVTLVCNAKRPSVNPFFYSWIERVPTTPALEQKLAMANPNSNALNQMRLSEKSSGDRHSLLKTMRERASIYAQAGLWFDALASLSKAQSVNSSESFVREDFLSLLNQVGLTEVVKQERQRPALGLQVFN
ncbi:MAG TPA: hypothetical protein DCE56_28080 [Cyanobacteria bacterium UBA8553]|nr:hypothetical protein [Cyanobacteria bacterium UBA8553]HAJ60457.1 hypothetical protein [Cyanobacteria bacterium UBA8543]